MVQDTKKKTAAGKKTQKKAAEKKKTTATVKKTSRAKTSRRKTNLLKLCTEMNKHVTDAVDREIVKRFKTIIDTSEEDITKVSLTAILKEPENTDVTSFDERIQPYIKHYLFMLKRKESKKSAV